MRCALDRSRPFSFGSLAQRGLHLTPRVLRALGCLAFGLFSLLLPASALAEEVTLAWDPAADPNVAGYRLYYGYAQGSYEGDVDVGMETTITLTDLEEGQAYYFVLVTYDIHGEESELSQEVMHNGPPTDFEEDIDESGVPDQDEADQAESDGEPVLEAADKTAADGLDSQMLDESDVPLASVHAQATVNYNFEDGVLRGDPTSMKVPPKIITENGNKFMRITGSTGDCESIPADLCPPRNRSTVRFTSSYMSMPILSDSNRRQTYSADIRFHGDAGIDGSVFELFQGAPGGEGGYGNVNGTGPVVRFWRAHGHVYFHALYANETKRDVIDLGAIRAGAWHNYRVKAVWSHNPREGRLEVYVDGKLKKTITGRDVNLGPDSNRLPMLKLGLYGDHATGSIDVDNVKAGPSGGGDSTPPAPGMGWAVNTGGAQYIGSDGTIYQGDARFSGGSTDTTTAAITSTADDPLYQSWRYGNFSYAIPMANGDYLATLRFADNLWSQAGQRVFNVNMEGKVVLSKLDVIAKVGPKAAYSVTLPVTVTDGVLTIGFQPVVGNAMVSAIKVARESVSVSAPTNVRVVSGQ
jgi:Malectin domain/Polysaccharide lyase